MRPKWEDKPVAAATISGAGCKSSTRFASFENALDEFFRVFHSIPPQRPQGVVCQNDHYDDCERARRATPRPALRRHRVTVDRGGRSR
jgi:hypothetical protein